MGTTRRTEERTKTEEMGVGSVGPCGWGRRGSIWCGPLWLWEELAPWEGEGGVRVGGRGRGSAPQQRRAWNTDSLLLPGQMSPIRL